MRLLSQSRCPTMLLAVDDEIRRRFPRQYTAILGPIRLPPGGVAPTVVQALRQECEAQVELWRAAPPAAIEHWRELFRQMGARSGTRASVDGLFRRFVRDGSLPEIHPLVDLYNWLSLARLTPMAAYDSDFVAPGLTLRLGCGGEPFEPLGSPGVSELVSVNEVVYADRQGVVCRYWNWRDCHRTRVRPETCNAVFFADLTADSAAEAGQEAEKIARTLELGIDVPLRSEIVH